jgi:hypothetical protein
MLQHSHRTHQSTLLKAKSSRSPGRTQSSASRRERYAKRFPLGGWQSPFLHSLAQARKALKLDSLSKPRNEADDARLELEARNEERDIKRICDQLGLDMYEVLSVRLLQYRTLIPFLGPAGWSLSLCLCS